MRNSSGSSVIVSFLVSSVIGSSSGHSVIGSSLGSFFIGSALRSLVIESCSGSWVQVLGSTVESSVLFLRYAWFDKDKVPDYKIKYTSKFTLLPGGALTTIAINNAIMEQLLSMNCEVHLRHKNIRNIIFSILSLQKIAMRELTFWANEQSSFDTHIHFLSLVVTHSLIHSHS